jgi:hypothetical protein
MGHNHAAFSIHLADNIDVPSAFLKSKMDHLVYARLTLKRAAILSRLNEGLKLNVMTDRTMYVNRKS